MTKRMLSEPEGYRLLADHGIPVPEFFIAGTRKDVAEGARRVGYPLVMKVISPQVIHKSDAGGVITGIMSAADAENAFVTIERNLKSFDQTAVFSGVILEQQKKKGLEILIGGRQDPTFGKVITVGMGGTLVELIKDVSIRVLPVSPEDISAMLFELQAYPLISGYRNEPALDREALIAMIDSVARLFIKRDDVVEFDLNPVFLYEKGACVVDARFYVTDEAAPQVVEQNAVLPPGILNAKSIAVIGASPDPNKVGYAVLRNLLAFPGKLFPVNPKHSQILGRTVFPTLTSIPDPVDIAVIVVPARLVPEIIKEAGKKGIPLVIIISSGFRESGNAGCSLKSRFWQLHGSLAFGLSARTALASCFLTWVSIPPSIRYPQKPAGLPLFPRAGQSFQPL